MNQNTPEQGKELKKEQVQQQHEEGDCPCPSCNGDGEIACEACGVWFLVIDGYYEEGEYAYCADCCRW